MNQRSNLKCYCFNPACLELQINSNQVCRNCGSSLQLQNRYLATEILGQGGVGRTFLAIDLTQIPPGSGVIKQYWNRTAEAALTEIRILKTVGGHPQIPALLDSFEQAGNHYLVQEYLPGRTLATVLQEEKITTATIWLLLESLLPILQLLQAHDILHRDLKPTSIIAQTAANSTVIERFTLVDFGSATFRQEQRQLEVIGSPEYAAPEQVKGNAVFASDLYSLGVICIHLLTGIHPFQLFNPAESEWIWRDYWFTDDVMDERLVHLLDQLIAPSLSQRLASAEMAIAELQRLRGRKIAVPVSAPVPRWDFYATLVGHEGLFASVTAVAVTSSSELLASASEDKTIRIWDLPSGKAQFTLLGHTQFVQAVAFHPAMDLLASGSRDRTIKLWDLHHQCEIKTLAGHAQGVNAIAFSPDGSMLASGSADKTVKLWNLQTSELIATLAGHTLTVNAIAFCPTLPLLASASADKTVQIWDLTTMTSVCRLTEHTWTVRAVAFSLNGTLLATTGEDKTIRLWEVASWQCLRVFSGHPWSVSALAFSPDGQVLISGSWDKTVKLWQVNTGEEIATLMGHTDSVNAVAIAPNAQIIISGSKDRTVKLWKSQN